LEEKAKQLALTSKYKSEFLANMSHELRTPLNSLLILSDQLSKNNDSNLTPRQVDFARTIHSSGNELLALINDILDLSKIESGTVIVDLGEVGFRDLQDYVDRTFRHVAENKKLDLVLDLAHDLPRSMQTDAKRLQQILKNLLSNAFKFTERGKVELRMEHVTDGWSPDNESLNRAKSVIAFSVIDTGIGIPPEKQQIIFEAFQQAMARPAASTAARVSAWRSAASWLGCSAARSSSAARPVWAARLRCTCPSLICRRVPRVVSPVGRAIGQGRPFPVQVPGARRDRDRHHARPRADRSGRAARLAGCTVAHAVFPRRCRQHRRRRPRRAHR
jgi:hypothetical protein